MKEKEGITKGIGQKLAVSLLSAAIIGIAGTLVPGGWSAVFAFAAKSFAATSTWLGSSLQVPVWLLLILSLTTVAAVVTGAVIIYIVTRKEAPLLPTEGTYLGLKWRWRTGRYGIEDLTSFCPHCDLQLYPQNRSTYRAVDRIGFKCDDCRWESEDFEVPPEVLRDQVIRSIQKDYRANRSRERKD